jgi:hypothetical protein
MTQPLSRPRDTDSIEQREPVWKSAQIGIELCRRKLWKDGLAQLASVAADRDDGQPIPSLALTYLGYGIASQQGRIFEGMRYCRAGVDREIWRAENHLNLARTYLVAGQLKLAIAALDYGLGLEPTNPAMLELRLKLGVRRSPTFPFLDRRHPLNRIAGKLRHRLAGFAMPCVLPAPKSVRDPA